MSSRGRWRCAECGAEISHADGLGEEVLTAADAAEFLPGPSLPGETPPCGFRQHYARMRVIVSVDRRGPSLA
jgi:hypothetical protein